MTFVIRLPYVAPPLSLNDRMHWAQASRLKIQLKADVYTLAMHHKLPKNVDQVRVTLVWLPKDRRRRDTDNPTATLKVCIDALKDYGLVADDDSTHVTSSCEIGNPQPGGALLLKVDVLSPAATVNR